MTAAPLPLRAHARRYPCAVCGRHKTADRLIYSRWTRNRYCADIADCRRVADKRRNTDPRDAA